MKLNSKNTFVRSGGVEKTFQYQVANNPHVMNMLAKGIYSNQVRAPIRELSTNAWDAHVEVKNNEPFDVWLPTRDEPSFKIRDYGTGLSPENIESLYRIYGISTKSNSNDFNGCLGIGSKSPYAYTDMFVCVSYYNGTKYTYVNSKDECGSPTLNRMGSKQTNEPNGLEISFNVKPADISDFHEEAMEVYQWFPVQPRFCSSYKDIELSNNNDVTALMYGENWKLFKVGYNSSSILSRSKCIATMGYISYPIDKSFFVSDKTKGLSEDWAKYQIESIHSLFRLGIVMNFDIGEIEHDVSRESLQYTSKTINTISTRLSEIYDIIIAKLKSQLVGCKTDWEKRVLFNSIIYPNFGHDISQLLKTQDEFNYSSPSHLHSHETFKCTLNNIGNIHRTKNFCNYHASNSSVFVLNDIDHGIYAATKRYIEQNEDIKVAYVCKFEDKEEKQTFMDYIGIRSEDFVLGSLLPKLDRQESKVKQKLQHYFVYDTLALSYSRPLSKYWTEQDIDISYGGLYVKTRRYKIVKNNCDIDPIIIGEILEQLFNIGIINKKPIIYGVKTSHISRFDKCEKWNDFFTWATLITEEYLKGQKKNIEQIKKYYQFKLSTKYYDLWSSIKELHLIDFSSNSSFKSFIINIQDMNQTHRSMSHQYNNITNLCEKLNINLDIDDSCQTLINVEKQILLRYPMLKILEYKHSYSDEEVKKIVEYVNLIDSTKPTLQEN